MKHGFRAWVIVGSFVGVVCGAGALQADVKLPSIFGSHMVLQTGQPIPVWGKAAPGEAVTVRLEKDEVKAVADAHGTWKVMLPARPAATGLTMTVKGVNTIEFVDVAVGEVWLCSGQSNMAMTIGACNTNDRPNQPGDEPAIRFFTVNRVTAILPEDDCEGEWQVCSPETGARFSAVGYYFGRDIHASLKVPVGLINSSWGGTRIEPWTTREQLIAIPGFQPEIEKLDKMIARGSKLLEDFQKEQARYEEVTKAALALEADSELGVQMAQPGLDDSAWPTMEAGTQWEKGPLPDFDGAVWFRKAVDVPAEWAGHDLVLNLGPVDEVDVTWFNAVRVGGMGSLKDKVDKYWDYPRVYTVPGAAVKVGRNVITVRCIDSAYAGGIWGASPAAMKLVPAKGDDQRAVSVSGPWKYKVALKFIKKSKAPVNSTVPTALYNAMIHPLVPYRIRGALWYQGESNLGDGPLYGDKMRALIASWRAAWGQGAFPFYYVQLAPFGYNSTNKYALAEIWEAQRGAMAITNTGMAITTDIGNLRDIHPRRKVPIGQRLALWALARTYGGAAVEYSGPLFKSAVREDQKIRVRFDHAAGLKGREGPYASWFELAGKDGIFRPVTAKIDATTVLVDKGAIDDPVRIRYGWAEEAEAELFNAKGIPAAPFQAEIVP